MKKKKILNFCLLIVIFFIPLFFLFFFKKKNSNINNTINLKKYDNKSLFLITDAGTIDDRSFNQGSWEGLKKFANEIGVKSNFIAPADVSHQSYYSAIMTAVDAGAKIIVTPGFAFESAVHQAQEDFPNVHFILVDGVPKPSGSNVPDIKSNTIGINFSEEQAGFLAGYAAVKEGFSKLGFMGGTEVNAVIRFGYGYINGADVAAAELNKNIEIKYTYLNSFLARPEFTTQASAWYNEGIEVIFAAAGNANGSVMGAAEKFKNKWVIGVDVDQKNESKCVITSAMKNLKKSVYEILKSIDNNNFEGGKAIYFTIDDDMLQISDDFSRFKNYNKNDNNKIINDLKNNLNNIKDNIPNEKKINNIKEIKLINTKLIFIE